MIDYRNDPDWTNLRLVAQECSHDPAEAVPFHTVHPSNVRRGMLLSYEEETNGIDKPARRRVTVRVRGWFPGFLTCSYVAVEGLGLRGLVACNGNPPKLRWPGGRTFRMGDLPA